MQALDINIISVLAATLAGMVLGAFWYSPVAFGKQWMAALGKSPAEIGSPALPMIGSVVACFVSALALACLISLAGVETLSGALLVGALVALGIVFPAFLSDNLFCGWGLQLLVIQSGYRISYILLMSLIIAGWPK